MQDRTPPQASVARHRDGTRRSAQPARARRQGAAEPEPERLGLHRRRRRDPRPRCGAIAWRSTPSRSGRGCCATSARSMPRSANSGASCACRWCSHRSARLESFHAAGRRIGGARGRRVRRRAHAQLGLRPRAREAGGRRRPRRCASISSMCAATRRGSTITSSAPIAHGYAAFCLTVDTAHLQPARARHRQALRDRRAAAACRAAHFQAGARLAHGQAHQDRSSRFRSPSRASPPREDATIALDHGVEWIYVSNHGGRQLDHGRGSMDVLPEIVDAVAGRAKIMVDGSFCRGSDIVKAIAAGADLVGMGRMQCFALAAGGAGRRGAAAGTPGGRGAALSRLARRQHVCRARPHLSARRAAGERAARA